MNKLRRVTESESINTNCNDSCTNLVTTQPYPTADSAPPTPYREKLRRVTESEGINTNRPTILAGLVNAVPTLALSCLVRLVLPFLVLLSFLRPEGAGVNSQGRQPLESGEALFSALKGRQ